MSQARNTGGSPNDVPAKRQVTALWSSTGDGVEFSVYLDVGGSYFHRIVTITDQTVDLNDVCERITFGAFGVQNLDQPSGDLYLRDELGRGFRIGGWRTSESITEPDDVKLRFGFEGETSLDGDRGTVEIGEGELPSINIQRQTEDDRAARRTGLQKIVDDMKATLGELKASAKDLQES